MRSLLNFVQWLLSHTVWQGIAGVAQILAAGLTIYAVRQAQEMTRQGRAMLDQAQRERLELVRPAWELMNNPSQLEGANVTLARILLKNIGLGPALNSQVTFESSNGHHRECIQGRSVTSGAQSAILENDTLNVSLNLSNDAGPIAGALVISYITRTGEKVAARFLVSGHAPNVQNRHFEFTATPEMRTNEAP